MYRTCICRDVDLYIDNTTSYKSIQRNDSYVCIPILYYTTLQN